MYGLVIKCVRNMEVGLGGDGAYDYWVVGGPGVRLGKNYG